MIRWVTERLGTAPWMEVREEPGLRRLDVRHLVDKEGNPFAVVRREIEEGVRLLREGHRVVICCDYGMSRSSAIAAGILSEALGIEFDAAVRRVMESTGEKAIRLEVLSAVRSALGARGCGAPRSPPASRRILMTGGSGFVGSGLRAQLEARHEVIAPGRAEIDLTRDVVRLDLLARDQGVDTVLHLANPRVYTTQESLGQALVMLKNVLDVCVQNKLFLVFLSSWEVFSGYHAKELRAEESLAPCPGGTYGYAKHLCEVLIEQYRRQHRMSSLVLRSTPVYGAGSDRPRFIWTFLDKALRNEEIVAHRYRNDLPRLDLLHVSDLRSAVLAALERRLQGVLHLGTGVGTSTTEVAEWIVRRVGSRSGVRQIEVDGFASNIVMEAGKAAEVLDWHPTVDVARGLEEIVQAGQGRSGTIPGVEAGLPLRSGMPS